MSELFFSLDQKDAFYIIVGLAFLTLKLLPYKKVALLSSEPLVLIFMGAALSFSAIEMPFQNIQSNALERKILEHFTELVVIISLAGAGLAIDRRAGLKSWSHTWVLILLVMPLTILSVSALGHYILGLPLLSAVLLGSVLAPTDPVLARPVQVYGPKTGEENDVDVTLTSEAGLNDGLAFPFVYLAIAMAAMVSTEQNLFEVLWEWAWYDLFYRVSVGLVVGLLCGYTLGALAPKWYSQHEKIQDNFGLVLMSLTFVSYGMAEIFSGYGFLAVFIAALYGKSLVQTDESDDENIKLPHMFSDQLEKIAIALLMIWLGYYAFTNLLNQVTIAEVVFSIMILLLVRPIVSYTCLLWTRGSKINRFAISFLGIRGIGSLYYLAYANNSESFENLPTVWRVTVLVIIFSVILHGLTAKKLMSIVRQ